MQSAAVKTHGQFAADPQARAVLNVVVTSDAFFAHPTAVIDPGCEIGEGTKIWHFCHVMPKAKIGRECSLGQNVFVADNVRIGDGVKIQNNVSLFEGVELEDHVFCGPSMVFTNVLTPRAAFPRNTSDDYQPTRVRRGASLGANCTIVCGTTVGAWAFVAAGAVVTRDVPPHALVAGVPARRIAWGKILNAEQLEAIDRFSR